MCGNALTHMDYSLKKVDESPGAGWKMKTGLRRKILVVDGDLLSIAHISQALLGDGYVLSHSTDLKTALQAVRNERPDLIICNLDGQHPDSCELASEVQQSEGFRAIPFLFLVGSPRDPAPAPEILGPKQYLSKPFTREQLTSAVQAHLDWKRQRSVR